MKNAAPTEEHFSLAKDYDYRVSSGDSHFGVFAGQQKTRFLVEFYDESVAWVRERLWAEDQKITETGDSALMEFTSTQFDKVLEWVLSRGCTARPLEPAGLVKAWRGHIRELAKMAGRRAPRSGY
jgi:hypothetical protein